MGDEFKYKNIKMTYLDDAGLDLKSVMSDDAYDVYIHCDDNFWIGDDGKIYEFEYFPCDEQFIREYDNWGVFNKVYPK